MVVKALMKMEDGVDSGKQLSEKDGGSNLFSLPPALLFPPSDCLSFNEEPTYLKGPFRLPGAGGQSGCDSNVQTSKGMSATVSD